MFSFKPRFTVWDDPVEVMDFTQTALQTFYDTKYNREILCSYLAATLYWRAYQSLQAKPDPKLPRALQILLPEIENHLSEDMSVDDIADIVDMSASHLHSMFREHLKTTPHQYLTERRVQLARKLLASTDDVIKYIGSECGFQSVENFYRCFKRITKIPPGRYREIHSVKPAEF